MARIVLLGLGNEDVDVLTRLARLDPCPEVLAVHPDPEALILRLAAVASYPALTEPPRPREDDIVVVPSTRGLLDAQMLRPWREVGARILLPDAPSLVALAERELQVPAMTGAAVAERDGRAAERDARGAERDARVAVTAGPAMNGPSKPAESTEATIRASSDSGPGGTGAPEPPAAPPRPPVTPAPSQAAEMPSKPAPPRKDEPAPPATPRKDEPAAPAPSRKDEPVLPPPSRKDEPAPPPPSVWETPEETFRYLAAQSLGADQPVSLWWDGGADVWVPWVWTGEVPSRRPEPPEYGVEIPSRWGSFRLAVNAREAGRVPVAAFARVAEDLALRDLMVWRHEARRFAAHGLPEPDMKAADLHRWAEPLLAHLGADSLLLWRREGDRYRLLHAEGGGFEFSGTLLMPAARVAATFETDAAGWRRWDPLPWLRVHLGTDRSDPRWPLKLRRMELALAGEDTPW